MVEERTTPATLNYYMPAEFQEHECSWMSWPCEDDGIPDSLEAQHRIYADVANAIVNYEPVNMLVDPGTIEIARAHCDPRIDLIPCPLDDAWLRDNGPIFVVSEEGRLGGVAWQFTGWGGKAKFEKDAKVAPFVLKHAGARLFRSSLVLEGGSITVDGEGTLIATEQCLLNPNRSGCQKEEIEMILADYLGIKKIIWLKKGLVGDEYTDGHVDLLVSFARPGCVMASITHNSDDPDYDILQDNLANLKNSTDAAGRKLDVIEVELAPGAIWRQPRNDVYTTNRLCGSYINFYFANGAVIIPGLDDDKFDKNARAVFERTFPDRDVVQVPTLFLYVRGGNIHCITQQQPKV